MKTFFGVLSLLIGSVAIVCGGTFIQMGSGSAPAGLLLGLLPGGMMLVLGFGLLLRNSSPKKPKTSTPEEENPGQEKSE